MTRRRYSDPMDPVAQPVITREELEARWAAARQAPPEEIAAAEQWARQVIDSLREDGDEACPAA